MTQFWGAFNDNVFKNALVILITFKAISIGPISGEQMVALCGGIFILPFFLFSAISGQICDKYSKSTICRLVKYAEIFIMIMGAIAFMVESIYLLIFILFLMGLQSTFFGPVKYSILPELLKDKDLVEGTALVEMGTFVSILLGTILGGVLVGISNIYVSIAVVLLAILGAINSKFIPDLPATTPDLKINYGLIKANKEILQITKEIKSVWLSILGISWFWFLGAIILSIFPVYVQKDLHGNEHLVTLFLALFSIGVAIGSILCEKMSKDHLELGLVPIGSFGLSLFLYLLSTVETSFFQAFDSITISQFFSQSSGWLITLYLLLFSLFSGFFIVPLYTFIQHRSEESKRSRVIAGNNIINALFMVVASLFLTFLFSKNFTSAQIFFILSLLNLIVAGYIYTVLPEFIIRLGCVLFSRFFYKLNVSGTSHIPKTGAAVLICNHVSFIDWLIISAGIKRPVRFVMHHSFMKLPILPWFFKGAKVIPIASKKGDEITYNNAFTQISNELNNGEIVCLFPEGKITSDGKMNEFKPGVFKIIETSSVPLIPMAINGLWGSFFSRKYGSAMSKPTAILGMIFKPLNLNIGPILNSSKDITELERSVRELLD